MMLQIRFHSLLGVFLKYIILNMHFCDHLQLVAINFARNDDIRIRREIKQYYIQHADCWNANEYSWSYLKLIWQGLEVYLTDMKVRPGNYRDYRYNIINLVNYLCSEEQHVWIEENYGLCWLEIRKLEDRHVWIDFAYIINWLLAYISWWIT